MNPVDWLLTGLDIHWWNYVLAAALAITWIVMDLLAPRYSKARGEAFANEHAAYVDAAYTKQFDRASIQDDRRRSLLIGVPVVLFMLVASNDGSVLAALAPGLIALGLGAENVLRLRRIGREFDNSTEPNGVARVRAVGVRDYVAPAAVVCWSGGALVTIVLDVGVAAALVRNGMNGLVVAQVIAAVACTALVVGLPACWQLTVSRPERSVDAAHLYLQDAWRAGLLRNATMSMFMAVFLTMSTFSDAPGIPISVTIFALPGFVLALGAYWRLDDAKNIHFRKRLWPTLSPGQVLKPGDVVPSGVPT